jgi:macrolide transport system ATP-binding/permease protein
MMMDALKFGWARVSGLFKKRAIENDMGKEMQFHVDMLVREYEGAGMSHEDARIAARRRFGNITRLKEKGRDIKGGGQLDELRQDLYYGVRMLWRSPGFAILAILCLTVGIGANAAVYSWIEGVLFRPYPLVAEQDRLLVLSGTAPGAVKGTDVSWPDFLDFRRNCTLIEAFIAEKIVGTTLSAGGDRADRISGSVVSANYFDAMGVHPILGRAFEPEEEVGRNAHPVVVISYELWQNRFRGDPRIIGKTQMMNGLPHTIIGVTPQGFYGTFVGYAFQFWVPASMQETFDPGGYKLEERGARWIEGFVRPKPGVALERAQSEIAAVAKRLEADYPATNRARSVKLLPVWKSPFNPMEILGPTLAIALVVVSAVLLIACANVGNLLLLKSFARRHEMTVRLAVGAGRRRLLKQLLTEGLILSSIATFGGIMLAYWVRNALALIFPPRGSILLRLPADLDWRVLGLSAGVCLLATLLFGLAPAIVTSKIDLSDALKSESGGVVGGRGKAWVRSAMVLVQISLSFVLLVGAGLVIQSLVRIRATNPGFSTSGVMTTSIDLIGAGYNQQRALIFEDELLQRLQSISGVESAAFSRTTPFSFRPFSSATIGVDGFESAPGEAPSVEYNEVGPGYLATMGIPLLSGREFTRDDNETSGLVAVVNERMARQYWPGQDPVDKRLIVKGRPMRIVGVARVSKYDNVLEAPKPFFYVPARQNTLGQNLNVRTSLRPETFATALVREIHAIDPNLAPSEIISTREQLDRATSAQTIAVRLLGVFGGVAVLLAAIGLYGLISFSVAQSTREMGLRMALGATQSNLWQLVISQGLMLTALGVSVGVGGALLLTRLLGYLLYQVSPRDPLAFGAALVVMVTASLVASFFPAYRAMKTDPIRALRT